MYMLMLIFSIKLLGGDAVMRAAVVAVGVMFHRCTLVLPLFHYLCHFHTKRAKGKQGIGIGRGEEGRERGGVGCCQMRISEVELPEERHRRIEARQSIDRFRFRFAFAAGTKIRESGPGRESQGSNYYEG